MTKLLWRCRCHWMALRARSPPTRTAWRSSARSGGLFRQFAGAARAVTAGARNRAGRRGRDSVDSRWARRTDRPVRARRSSRPNDVRLRLSELGREPTVPRSRLVVGLHPPRPGSDGAARPRRMATRSCPARAADAVDPAGPARSRHLAPSWSPGAGVASARWSQGWSTGGAACRRIGGRSAGFARASWTCAASAIEGKKSDLTRCGERRGPCQAFLGGGTDYERRTLGVRGDVLLGVALQASLMAEPLRRWGRRRGGQGWYEQAGRRFPCQRSRG